MSCGTASEPPSAPASRALRPLRVTQNVRGEGGFIYVVSGADAYVFGNGRPVYLLHELRTARRPAPAAFRERPSLLLNSRYAVVGFTGRDAELSELVRWRDAPAAPLRARWLHAPGGQGKTRLMEEFAGRCAVDGWKVVTATHGSGPVHAPAAGQDLTLGKATGVLLLVDYADRWALADLTFLFGNSLLDQDVPVRVLLAGRTDRAWDAVQHELTGLDRRNTPHEVVRPPETSVQHLPPLPEEAAAREAMFVAARDAFAEVYGIENAAAIPSPGSLEHSDFGLTLTLHTAALVAVDAAARSMRPPAGASEMSGYLLHRERAHWEWLYNNRGGQRTSADWPGPTHDGLTFRTPPHIMARVVFTAALTGPVGHADGTALMSRLGLRSADDQLLTDHGLCYPPTDTWRATVLEPLYPDRLAEDFLAHSLAADETRAWARDALEMLLTGTATGGPAATGTDPGGPPPWLPRALTFLFAAAARGPHVGTDHLFPLLLRNPRLALVTRDVLPALAGLPTVPVAVLEAVEAVLPPEGHVELDVGIVALAKRLTEHRLTLTHHRTERARLHRQLARRQASAGQLSDAGLTAIEAMVALTEPPPAPSEVDTAYRVEKIRALTDLSGHMAAGGENEEALRHAEQALTELDEFSKVKMKLPAELASALASQAELLLKTGSMWHQWDQYESAKRAERILNRLAKRDPVIYGPAHAKALLLVSDAVSATGHPHMALGPALIAVRTLEKLAKQGTAAYDDDRAAALNVLGDRHFRLRQHKHAQRRFDEGLRLRRQLVDLNPDAHGIKLAQELLRYTGCLTESGRESEAVDTLVQALSAAVSVENPNAWTRAHLEALDAIALRLARLGHAAEVLPLTSSNVRDFRNLATLGASEDREWLAAGLTTFATVRALARTDLEAALAAATEAEEIYKDLLDAGPLPLPLPEQMLLSDGKQAARRAREDVHQASRISSSAADSGASR